MSSNRLIAITPILFLLACGQPTELSGVYVSQNGEGTFFLCDSVNVTFRVMDSALAARQSSIVSSPSEPAYVRLSAVKRRGGSPKGGWRYIEVRQILEVRARATTDCPSVAHSATRVLPS